MDSNLRDETRNKRCEEALARRLGEALDRAAPGGTEFCPDAELIAAYREQALGPDEAASCEMHFAGCSRCRKILAVLAASDDTPLAEKEVARLGELVAAASGPREAATQTTKAIRPNRLDWRMRWLGPALGAAAVLAVWFAMRPPWRAMNQGSSGTLIAQAPKNEPVPPAEAPPVDQISKEVPAKEVGSATSSRILKNQPAEKAESSPTTADELAKKSLDDRLATNLLAPKAKVAESAPANEIKEPAEANAALAGAAPTAPAPLVAPPPRLLAQSRPNATGQAAPPAPEGTASTTQSARAAGEAPGVATASGAVSNPSARDKQALTEQKAGSDFSLESGNLRAVSKFSTAGETAIQIKGPSGRVFWRVGKNGRIERSTNAGNAWIFQTSPLQQEWLAGAAVSDTTCWLVGRNGSIARTTDGEHWEKITPPPRSTDASGKFPDWVDVTASSAQAATIAASDQRRFATQDGGKTWRSQ